MAVGPMLLQFDNAVLEDEQGKVKGGKSYVKVGLALVPPDNTPPTASKAVLDYVADDFALTAESPLDYNKRYVLAIHEWVEG